MMNLQVRGSREMAAVLDQIAPRHAVNLMRSTVGGVAAEVRKDFRAAYPKKSGRMRKGIKSRPRKMRRNVIRADVMADRRAFYWRFLEYGTAPKSRGPKSRMRDRSGHNLPARGRFKSIARRYEAEMPEVLDRVFRKRLAAQVQREIRRRAKRGA